MPGLGLLDVVVGGLDQLEEDVLDVLTDVAGLGQRGGVGDRERDVEHPGQRLGEVGLAAAGRADHQDVGLGDLDDLVLAVLAAHGLEPGLDPLVVVVDRHGERLLRVLLADDVGVEELEDLLGLGQLVEADLGALAELLLDDLVAEVDALVADVDAGAGDELLDLLLALAAEGALQQVATVTDACHESSSGSFPNQLCKSRTTVPAPPPDGWRTRRTHQSGPRCQPASAGVPLQGLQHGVDQAVLDGALGGQDLVALDVAADLLDGRCRCGR